MESKEIMIKVLERKTKGFYFHDQMTDYYSFLHIDAMKCWHRCQAKEEYCELEDLKDSFMSKYCEIPFYHVSYDSLIPESWEGKTSMEIDEKTLKTLIKSSLETYLNWEEETLIMFKEYANELKTNQDFFLHSKVSEQVKDVEQEIMCVKKMIIDIISCDYNIEYIKNYN